MGELLAALKEVDWPAWVQALCAVVTIAFTVWLVRDQEGERIRDEMLRDASFVRDVDVVLKRGRAYITQASAALKDAKSALARGHDDNADERSVWALSLFTAGAAVRSCLDLRELLAALPVAAWPTPELYLAFRNEHFVRRKMVLDPALIMLDAERPPPADGYLADLERIDTLIDASCAKAEFGLLAAMARPYNWAGVEGLRSVSTGSTPRWGR